jgi:formate dehydrogenase subunit gamma
MIYWIVVLGGGTSAATGYLLLFPFYATGIEGMQIAQVVHAVVAMLFIAAMLGHIYIGTIGMEGAFEAMGEGSVDINWAKEHHRLWLEEELRRTPKGARAQPAEYAEAIHLTHNARLQSRAFCYKGPCALLVSQAGAVRAKPR